MSNLYCILNLFDTTVGWDGFLGENALYNMLTTFATCICAIGAIVAVIVQVWSFKLALGADVTLRVIEKFDDDKMLKLRKKAAESIRDYRLGKGTISKDVENVLDFFETIALFCRQRVMNRKIVWHSFYHWIRGYYWSAKDYIDTEQRDSPSTTTLPVSPRTRA